MKFGFEIIITNILNKKLVNKLTLQLIWYSSMWLKFFLFTILLTPLLLDLLNANKLEVLIFIINII